MSVETDRLRVALSGIRRGLLMAVREIEKYLADTENQPGGREKENS